MKLQGPKALAMPGGREGPVLRSARLAQHLSTLPVHLFEPDFVDLDSGSSD